MPKNWISIFPLKNKKVMKKIAQKILLSNKNAEKQNRDLK
jgi:hypothetical protein